MITAAISGLDAATDRLAALPAALAARLADTVARLGDELQDRVQNDKLAGGVLRRRSGRLADSIRVTLTASGTAAAATLASDVPYAAIHEYGGTIPAHPVVAESARALAFPWKGRQRFFRRVMVPAVRMPERSFLRSALADMAPEIRRALAAAARAAVQQ